MAFSMNITSPSLRSCIYFIFFAAAHGNTLYPSPAVYPSPGTQGLGGWGNALSQANSFVSKLTLAEKQRMVTGIKGPCVGNIAPISRLDFPGLCLQDGPLALRQATFASVFPAGLSVAATWDMSLATSRGAALGAEFKGKGSHIILGPVAGPLGRNVLGGRNWEGFSPDPYLTGRAFAATIDGMQSSGAQACVKHLIGNEQETQRFPSTASNGVQIKSVSSNIDDRTMHELYLWPFAEGVKAGAAAVMCSYNRVNGTYACENSKLINGLLKTELGFQGYVMSDWGAVHSGPPSIKGGLDMDMPGGNDYFGTQIGKDIKSGTYPLSRLNDMVTRIMTPYYHLKQDKKYPKVDPSCASFNGFSFSNNPNGFDGSGSNNRDVRSNHAALIRQIGADSAVLLKNIKNTLPLKKPLEIGVFGYDADAFPMNKGEAITISGGYKMGSLPVAGGSGTGRLTYVISPLDAIKAKTATYGAHLQYMTDNPTAINRATYLKPIPDVCLVFVKSWSSEGRDRPSLDADWDGNTVVAKVAAVCRNTVVINHSVGPNIMDYADNPNVTAIVAGHLPGQEIGNSIVDVLWGKVNPSGKLPYTIARKASDYNAPLEKHSNPTTANEFDATFTEGLHIDYRHFEQAKITPRYEFGFGLSYTTFKVSDLSIKKVNSGTIPNKPPAAKTQPGGNPHLYDKILSATCTIFNTGKVDGKTVVQLYISLPSIVPVGTPVKVLRGFRKIDITVGKSAMATFDVQRKDLSYWDVVSQAWILPKGEITLHVGLSSRDIQVTQGITLRT